MVIDNERKSQQAILAEKGKRVIKEKNLREIESYSRVYADRISEYYRWQAHTICHKLLGDNIPFEVNEHLTFGPSKVIITIGEKQRTFVLKRKENLEKRKGNWLEKATSMISGNKLPNIPESAKLLKNDPNTFLVEISAEGELLTAPEKYTPNNEEYVGLSAAIKELLLELNKEILEKEEINNWRDGKLIHPFTGLAAQINEAANSFLDEANIMEQNSRSFYFNPAKTK